MSNNMIPASKVYLQGEILFFDNLIYIPILSFLFGGVNASVEVPVIKQLSQSGFCFNWIFFHNDIIGL